MPCSVCRKSGHNVRTCPKVKGLAGQVRDLGVEEAADWIAQELGEEALSEIVEYGLDMAVPGAGTLVKACRYAVKASR